MTRQSSDDQSYCAAQFLEAHQAAVQETKSKLLLRVAIKHGSEPVQLIVQAITYPSDHGASRTLRPREAHRLLRGLLPHQL
jgi:hypothetical protein